MKNVYLLVVIVLTLSFLLVPLLAVEDKSANDKTPELKISYERDSKAPQSFLVYDSESKKTETIETTEYIVGVVACEMPAEYSEEALKAQALAAFTYAYRKQLQKPKNSEYDITTDTSVDQGYINIDGRKEKWKDKFDEYEKKAESAVKAVKNKIIVYNNEPILAVYHSISSGKTETAANVWGTDYAYLQAENSVGDLLSPDYLSEAEFSVDQFKEKLKALDIQDSGDPAAYIGNCEKTESGTVKEISICNKKISGNDVRKVFGLRSAAFDISYSQNKFKFTVTGHGHGVGMSQFGADYMAKQGSNCEEIIAAYYRGTKIAELK